MPSCDASAVVGERVSVLVGARRGPGAGRDGHLPGGPAAGTGGREDLAAAVDALLENVVAHTPEGTAFAVQLAPNRRRAPARGRRRRPGHRRTTRVTAGRSDRGSSGLGLDIARTLRRGKRRVDDDRPRPRQCGGCR